MTWPDYQRLLDGYNYTQTRQAEHTRAICYYSIVPYLPEGNRVSMQDFWPLKTDPEKQPENPERTLELVREILQAYQNKN